MITKIRASRILMTAGIQSVICSGEEPDALVRLARGESVGTLFDPPAERWILRPASCGLRWATRPTAR